MANAHNNRPIDPMEQGGIQVGIHEVQGSVEGGSRLCALGISTGIAVAIMGIYRDPSPNPRYDRCLLHAGDDTLDADLDKELSTARTVGLLELEAHILVPEVFSFNKRARRDSETSSQDGSNAGGNGSSSNSLAVNEWHDDDLRTHLATQKGLRERVDQLTRGGKVTWYRYPVCHRSGVSRWAQDMTVFADETVFCQSIDKNGQSKQLRIIKAVKEGNEDEDSGLRCC